MLLKVEKGEDGLILNVAHTLALATALSGNDTCDKYKDCSVKTKNNTVYRWG